MRSIDLALPFNWLARILGSFSVRTPTIVLALIPVAGFLANGVTYVSGEGDVGRADATVTQSHALVDSNRDFKSAVAVEAEGLEAQVRQSSPTCRPHDLAAEQWRSAPSPGLQSVQQ